MNDPYVIYLNQAEIRSANF